MSRRHHALTALTWSARTRYSLRGMKLPSRAWERPDAPRGNPRPSGWGGCQSIELVHAQSHCSVQSRLPVVAMLVIRWNSTRGWVHLATSEDEERKNIIWTVLQPPETASIARWKSTGRGGSELYSAPITNSVNLSIRSGQLRRCRTRR